MAQKNKNSEGSGERLPIVLVGGSKGGVGKSTVSLALADYVTSTLKLPLHIIETDDSNPDVLKACGSIATGKFIDIERGREGLLEMIGSIDGNQESVVVINTAA